MPARHLFFWSLPLACTLAMPLPLSAAVTLPDIVVTSTGAVLNVGEDYFRSGVDTSIGLGSVAPAFFAGGPVAQGEQVSVIIRGAPGTVFSLTPESMGLSLRFDFQGVENDLFDDASIYGTFLDVEGGSISDFQSGFMRSMSDRIYAHAGTEAPDAPITFSGIQITWTQPQAVVFEPMTLVSFAMFVQRPSDLPPVYFSVTPEPGRAVLMMLALGVLGLRRRRSGGEVVRQLVE
jgi:hypothetical protein